MRRAAAVVAALTVLVAASAASAATGAQAQTPAAPEAKPAAAATAPPDRCAACHLETGDDRLADPVKAYAGDIHRAKGFGCVACHGGDAREEGMEAMDPAKGYIGKPEPAQMAQVCGRCHSDARFMRQYNPSIRVDQVAEYATSGHGRRLREAKDTKVATCASCHPAHAIKPPSDPVSSVHPLRVAETCGKCHGDAKYMAGRRLPTDQVEKYKKSVHWEAMSARNDLSAPTCNDCHGNHGASPPGVSWVGNVCGQCHTVMADLFKTSVHARAFAQMGVPGCATCHANHDIAAAKTEMIGLAEGSFCGGCHTADDPGGKATTEIRRLLDALRTDQTRALATVEKAEHAGMEVSSVRFELNGATDALVKARAAVHAATVAAVKTEADTGLAIAAKGYARALRALDDVRFRRQGLAVSLVVIVILIAAVLFKIRQLESRRAPDVAPSRQTGERA